MTVTYASNNFTVTLNGAVMDAFYSTFAGGALSGLVATRG